MMEKYLNKEIVTFILKALVIYIIWYILYDRLILPDGRVDYWLSHNIVLVTAGLLHLIGYKVYAYGRIAGIAGSPGIEMLNGCNGLSAIGLFLGFIIAFPGDPWKRLLFSVSGILILYVINVIRIALLIMTVYWKPSYFNFAHAYTGNAVYYSVIFVLWVIWVNTKSNRAATLAIIKTVA